VARSGGGAISIFNSSVEGNAVGSVGGAAVVVGSDTSLCVGARASVAGNSFSGGALANVQLNASRLTLSSPLETEFYVTPNHIGGASYSIFGVVGFDYGGDLQVLSASASNFINDITLEKGVVVTNSAGSAYLAWAGAFAAGGDSVTSNGEKFYLAGARPELPPSILPAEPVAIAFVSIAKNAAGTHWQLKLTPAVEKCRYFLYAIDSLSDGFVLPADGAGAEQSFTATADGEFMFEVPVSADDKRFFKVLALPEALDR
jgi:hypothetical protein